jgi:hypothetical protein
MMRRGFVRYNRCITHWTNVAKNDYDGALARQSRKASLS